MEKSLHYRSQRITVRAITGPSVPVSYDSQIFIVNAVHRLNKNDKYPPKGFPTPNEAIAYGLEAAKWLVDRGPAATTGGPLKKKKGQRHIAAQG
jgi:hypothetical protein